MRIPRLLSPALACLTLSTPLGAQVPAPDPLYHVEIIVFAYLNPDRAEEDFRHGRENRLPGPSPRLYEFPALELETLPAFGSLPGFGASTPPANASVPGPIAASGVDPNAAQSATQVAPRTDLLDLIELADGGARLAGGNRGEAPPLPDGFRILRAEELSLTAEAGSLARDADYRVLGHAGWAQTGVDTDRSVALDLKYLGLTNPAGTVEFYIGRRRHVIVDLSYFDGTASFWSAPVAPGIAPLVYAESYRLQQEGNDLGDALTYFDHPMFGVLILIERAPAPQNPNGGDSAGGPAA